MLSNFTIAQENLDTKSDQALTVAIDSTYKYRASKANKSSENQFMGEEINPLEDPNNFEQNGNLQEKNYPQQIKVTVAKYRNPKVLLIDISYKKKMNVLKENLKVAKKAKEIGQIAELENQLNSIEVDLRCSGYEGKREL